MKIYEQISTLKISKFPGVLNIHIYPYGNAEESQNPDGSWSFKCQHGSKECYGNLLEACILNRAQRKDEIFMPIIHCIESSYDPLKSAQKCVSTLSKFEWNDIQKCAKVGFFFTKQIITFSQVNFSPNSELF